MDGLFHGKPYEQMDDLGGFPIICWKHLYQHTNPTIEICSLVRHGLVSSLFRSMWDKILLQFPKNIGTSKIEQVSHALVWRSSFPYIIKRGKPPQQICHGPKPSGATLMKEIRLANHYSLHSLKLTFSPLKIVLPKRKVEFQTPFLRGENVSFREGTSRTLPRNYLKMPVGE